MATTSAFQPFAPGFDFLQGLVQNAGAAMPGIGQWVAPTLDPQELDKRIQELRTVQFWLEQNARMLGATIQALEVQKMTLSTLRTMNVQMGDLRDALTPRAPEAAAPAAQAAPAPAPAAAAATPAEEAPAAVDPMQWWNALTQQFGELAASAIKDIPTAPAPATARAAAQASAGAAAKGKAAPATKAAAARKKPAARSTQAATPRKPPGR
jgi:hypothetical protein